MGFAETGDILPTTPASLSLKNIKVLDDHHVRVVFTESVDTESVTLKLNKQSDNSSIRINVLTGVTDSPEAIDLTLEDGLEEASSYSIVAIAAVGISGATITDGAQAIKDFVTPSPLKKVSVILSAPTNPAAVMAKTGSTNVKVDTPLANSPIKVKPTPTEELPLTGMNPLFLLVIVLPLAYFLLRRRAE